MIDVMVSLERFDMIRNINEIEYRKHFEVAEACVASLIGTLPMTVR
jgi:hypothetical protein